MREKTIKRIFCCILVFLLVLAVVSCSSKKKKEETLKIEEEISQEIPAEKGGKINISDIGDVADHGQLAFTGSVNLYSPKNYNGYGDVVAELGLDYPICDPVE